MINKIRRSFSIIQQINERKTEFGNVNPKILSFVGRNIYKNPNHPLGILKGLLERDFQGFKVFDSFNPIVTVKEVCYLNMVEF